MCEVVQVVVANKMFEHNLHKQGRQSRCHLTKGQIDATFCFCTSLDAVCAVCTGHHAVGGNSAK